MALLFISQDDPAELWRDELLRRMPELEVRIWPEVGDPDEVQVALVWRPPPGSLRQFPNLKAILSLGAGIDSLIADETLPDVPLAKMVDPSLTRTMSEYVLAAVLRHHRGLDQFERAQRERRWDYAFPPQAAERRVGVLGLGELGLDAAVLLRDHGFPVAGWSRSVKEIDGIESFGGETLDQFLGRTDILVCLLPLTADTRGILNTRTFSRLPEGAFVINAARG
ncbi:MAG: NAD(P)-dependent oxidoreductase, partial [Geminicoccaceae bacterium]|nr:NAD(P)-dependent oxidoreductase [Geminicoccaceae bacterium]